MSVAMGDFSGVRGCPPSPMLELVVILRLAYACFEQAEGFLVISTAFVRVPVSVLADAELSVSARLMFALVLGLSHQSGFCWASNAYFAQSLGCSVSKVHRVLRELAKRELVRVELSADPAGATVRRLFPVLVSAVDQVVPPRVTGDTPHVTGDTPPVSLVTPKYDNLNTIKNTHARRRSEAALSRDGFVVRVRELCRDSRNAPRLADARTANAVKGFGGWSALGRMTEYEFGRCAGELYRRYLEAGANSG